MKSHFVLRSLFATAFLLLTGGLAAQRSVQGSVADTPAPQGGPGPRNAPRGQAGARSIADVLTRSGVPAVVLEGDLGKDLGSRNTKAGDEVLLTLRRPAVLPGGLSLAQGTTVRGHIVQVAAHDKANRNGVMLINFDEIRPKGSAEIPIFAVLVGLAPSEADQTAPAGFDVQGGGGGGRGPGAGSGGGGDGGGGRSGPASGTSKTLVVASAGGSGALMTLNDNVKMYGGEEMILVAGPQSPTATVQRAYAILHPASANGDTSANR